MSSEPRIPENIAPSPEASEGETDSAEQGYHRILRASAIIGMSSAVNIGIGVIRTKAIAMLLGPAGFGLMGLYSSICDVAVSIAGMGVNNSGVRQIADAASSDDPEKIARTVTVLRRVSVGLGLLGAGALVALSAPISKLTFGDESKATAVTVLALAVFLRLIAAGQGALLQGLRRIGDIAKVSIASAGLATIVSLAIIYVLGQEGVSLSIVAAAAASSVVYWWYCRKLRIETLTLSVTEVAAEATDMMKLGAAFMLSSFLMMASGYAARLIVARELTIDAAGLYSAAWTLGGLYVGYVLQAMGADFYPQLVGVSNDHPRCNRIVNDQMLVSLLLAGPGILATIAFAPLVISLFYSKEFTGAVEVLRWICAGMAIRVITWPMGFIIVAKNRQLLFLAVDVGWTAANIGLIWLLVTKVGLAGSGVAFLLAYLLHGIAVYPIAHALTGFTWTTTNKRVVALYLASIILALAGSLFLPPLWSLGSGAAIMMFNLYYSTRMLLQLLSGGAIPPKIARLLSRVNLLSRRATGKP